MEDLIFENCLSNLGSLKTFEFLKVYKKKNCFFKPRRLIWLWGFLLVSMFQYRITILSLKETVIYCFQKHNSERSEINDKKFYISQVSYINRVTYFVIMTLTSHCRSWNSEGKRAEFFASLWPSDEYII